MKSGAARKQVDLASYKEELEARLGKQYEMMRLIINKAKREPKRIVFAEGMQDRVLRACQVISDEGFAMPILLGDPKIVDKRKKDLGLDFPAQVVDPWAEVLTDRGTRYVEHLVEKRARKGVTSQEARELLRNRNYFGSMMVEMGDADGFISGVAFHYQDALRPALQVIGIRPQSHKVVGCYMLSFHDRVLFLADATVNIEPSEEDLAEIAMAAARIARKFEVLPRVAMLSFSNFGSSQHPAARKVARAAQIVKEREPTLMVDGEMQADTAIVPEILQGTYPFSSLKEAANVLVFPSLESANTAYKLLQRLANAQTVGPILEGMSKAVHICQRGDDVQDIVNMAAICVVDAQDAQVKGPAVARAITRRA
jgi:malate dehydrogenase (oxaloacetate-decarboxylating)(NADP+)